MISRMLVVDQKQRWSAQQLLNHPWILSYESTLPSLDSCLKHLRRYTARKKLRAVARVVMLANRMKKFSSGREELRRYQEKHAHELHKSSPSQEKEGEKEVIPAERIVNERWNRLKRNELGGKSRSEDDISEVVEVVEVD